MVPSKAMEKIARNFDLTEEELVEESLKAELRHSWQLINSLIIFFRRNQNDF